MVHENNLWHLMGCTTSEMEKLGYSSNSMKRYWEVWNRYLKFTNEDTVNRTDMDSFLADKYGIDTHSQKPTRYQRNALRAMNVLEYYSKTRKVYIRFPLADPTSIDNRLTPAVERFVLWMRKNGYAETTIHTHERVAKRFLNSATNYGLENIVSVDTSHISNFIMEITSHCGKVSYELNPLRVFFCYLHRNGMVTEDLALFIPASNRLWIREHLPAIWGGDDVSVILQCVDRDNPVEKRNYAMILLTVRLGLRGSNIKKLYFSDIDWEKETLTITQQKTKELLVLPLLYRTLYCCRGRVSEATGLTLGTVDLKNGILFIKETKDYCDRIIPLSGSLTDRYREYRALVHKSLTQDDFFFRLDYGKRYSTAALEKNFREILWECGISYGGRKKGPHLHDIRHTFSVHCLQNAMNTGHDIQEFLPVLSSYLGNKTLNGTQWYLHLTVEFYPDIRERLEAYSRGDHTGRCQ